MATIIGTDSADRIGVSNPTPGLGSPTNNPDTISGLGGDDLINGLAGADLVDGGEGDDTLIGGGGNDTLNGGDGDDVLEAVGTDTLNGGDGNDVILSDGARADGGAGDDTFLYTADIGGIVGGAGFDVIRVSFAGESLFLSNAGLAAGHGIERISNLGTADRNPETVRGSLGALSAFAGLSITGANNPDTWDLFGVTLEGVELVSPLEGADFVATSTDHVGFRTLYDGRGGVGGDHIQINLTGAQLAGLAPSQIDALQAYVAAPGGKTLDIAALDFRATGFERASVAVVLDGAPVVLTGCLLDADTVIVGTDAGEALHGTNGKDLILGLDGDDTLNGKGGDDCLYGAGGNDDLTGAAGADRVFGGGGNDVIRETVNDTSADTLSGGDGDDTIVGTWNAIQNDVLDGGAGNDVLQHGGGNLQLILTAFGPSNGIEAVRGAAGSDPRNRTIWGTDGADALDFSGVAFTDIERIELRNGDDAFVGSAGGDTVNGGAGNDTIDGGNGDDTIDGGAGVDSVRGGGGDDLIIDGNGAGGEALDGGAGDDTISAGWTDLLGDAVSGGAGADTIRHKNNSLQLQLDSFGPGASIETIVAGTGTDSRNQTIWGTDAGNALDFSGTTLAGFTRVQLRNGNDAVTTARDHTARTDYDGGGGTDAIALDLSAADYSALVAAGQLGALEAYVAAPTGKVLDLSSLDFTARNFESASLAIGSGVLRVATVLDATDATPENNAVTVPQGGSGNPTSVSQSTPIDNGTDRFAAYLDVNDDGSWDPGEAREDLATFGNGTFMTGTDAAGGLVDVASVGGAVSGNQFFVGVGSGGHVSGTEKIVFTLTGATVATGGAITIRGPVNSNPQNNPLADIAAGTAFDVFLFDDADDDGLRDAGEEVGSALSFTVDSARQAFTAEFAASGGATFDGVEIAAKTNAFTLDSIEFALA